jgi:NADPH:quinone reductase-like Zn-dependent oxidoreductase
MADHTMQAIQVHQYGTPRQLKLEEIPRPEPQADEVLVHIHAAGVLPMETAVRQGMFPGAMPRSFPYIPGTAFAGVVEAVGENVTRFKVGDAICGRAPSGTYAEYATININPPPITPKMERWRHSAAIVPLAPKPRSLTFDEAAALSGGATTAWTSLFEDGNVQAGQRVLIHAAAGGVGLFAVQFAKWKGAYVIGTASAANVDYVRSIGADEVVDYASTPFEEVAREVDFVLDTIGGETMQRSMKIIKRGGMLVSVVDVPPADLAESLGIRAINNQVVPASEHLLKIVEVIDAGYAKAAIREIFPLSEAYKAHELCETGHGRGRIVLHIAD